MRVTITDHRGNVKAAFAQAIRRALEITGMQVAGYAKKACPKDTGNLQNSIKHKVDGNSVTIGTNVEYAWWVETGTKKMPARPYLKPAVTEHTGTIKGIFTEAFGG